MSAYTPAFISESVPDIVSDGLALAGRINPASVPIYEPLMAAGEIITAGVDEDIVMEIADYIPLSLIITEVNVSQTDTISDGTQTYVTDPVVTEGVVVAGPPADPTVPYTPPITTVPTPPPVVVIPAGTTIPAGTATVPAMYIRQVIAEAGAFALVRTMGATNQINSITGHGTTHMIYDSSNSGANFTRRAPTTIPLCLALGHTAMSASNGSYVHIPITDKRRELNPIMRLTTGIVGQDPILGSKQWERPYLPLRIAHDGTKFVLLTEGNRIYHSTDRVTWTHVGTLSSPIPTFFSSLVAGNGNASILGELWPKLFWLPVAQIWVLLTANIVGWYTADINAVNGWLPWASSVEDTHRTNNSVNYTAMFYDYSNGEHKNRIAGLLEIGPNLMYAATKLTFPNLNQGPMTGWGNFEYNTVHKSVDKGVTWELLQDGVNFATYSSYYNKTKGLQEVSPGVYSVVNIAANNMRFFPRPNVYTQYLPSGVANISDFKYARATGDGGILSGAYYEHTDCLGFS